MTPNQKLLAGWQKNTVKAPEKRQTHPSAQRDSQFSAPGNFPHHEPV
jgi:hypothetical protein